MYYHDDYIDQRGDNIVFTLTLMRHSLLLGDRRSIYSIFLNNPKNVLNLEDLKIY